MRPLQASGKQMATSPLHGQPLPSGMGSGERSLGPSGILRVATGYPGLGTDKREGARDKDSAGQWTKEAQAPD